MAKVEQKAPIVAEIKDVVDGAEAVVLVAYSGINVAADTALRKDMREAGVTYKVFKNTMMKRAFEGTPFEKLNDQLEGPNAIAVSKTDAPAPARIIAKYAKTAPMLKMIGGVVEGDYYDEKGVTALATVPSREELLGKLLGSIQSPISNLARVINQIAEQQGGGAAPAEEAAAE